MFLPGGAELGMRDGAVQKKPMNEKRDEPALLECGASMIQRQPGGCGHLITVLVVNGDLCVYCDPRRRTYVVGSRTAAAAVTCQEMVQRASATKFNETNSAYGVLFPRGGLESHQPAASSSVRDTIGVRECR